MRVAKIQPAGLGNTKILTDYALNSPRILNETRDQEKMRFLHKWYISIISNEHLSQENERGNQSGFSFWWSGVQCKYRPQQRDHLHIEEHHKLPKGCVWCYRPVKVWYVLQNNPPIMSDTIKKNQLVYLSQPQLKSMMMLSGLVRITLCLPCWGESSQYVSIIQHRYAFIR
jgi:hypothetical protein